MPEPTWVPIARELPRDGQVVLVRGKHATTPQRATFRATPVPRWDIGVYTHQRQYFDEWAEAPPQHAP